eukprot:CAMPEP_0185042110 /NCGR_PEP_ID=MMETSP1103-20130426/42154_1 /TAXON_ID=36769 /ORGANISM="Paraphysomonas bandaiensis, Strain Caron Lab Isolate" /LENGTH=580 /DNA_ID=CAMNT_0027582119 /DNA_START=43 /DNA_END=1786 /DNA_ORIENTATION=-
MKTLYFTLTILTLSLLISPGDSSLSGRIKHVIILMLENRSFDHMLGFLKLLNKEVNGCLPHQDKCWNHMDPQDLSSPTVTVDDTAVYRQVDPHHAISWTTQQVYGYPRHEEPPQDAEPSMDGFIITYIDANDGNETAGAEIMKCFSPEHVPIMTNLSMEFGFFDGWYASVPGPTMVNRAYAASATSHGMGTNDDETMAKGLPQKTMFQQLLDMGLDYRVYVKQIATVAQFKDMRQKEALKRYRFLNKLYEDLETGDIPEFVWVEPAYFTTPRQEATDQHPDHDVSLGEALVRDIYEAVRKSTAWEETGGKGKVQVAGYLYMDLETGDIPEFVWVEPAYFTTEREEATDQHPDHDVSLGEALVRDIYEAVRKSTAWEETVFMITYDEHGGFFDHVPPPENVPNPDGLNATDDPFDFTRLGVRVPTVVVSPWVKKGSVFHAPDSSASGDEEYGPSQYEHSSIVSTVVHELFAPAEGYSAPEYLTKRDEWAKTFGWIFDELDEVRTDCPETLPEVFSIREHIPDALPANDGSLPLSDLQLELIHMIAGAAGDNSLTSANLTEWREKDGGEYCLKMTQKILSEM